MLNLLLILLLFVVFFLSTLKLSFNTLSFIFIFSFITNKLYNSKPMYFLFYIFFIFFYVLLVFKFYNFTLMFLVLSVVYATIFIIFFIFFVSYEDLKKTKEVFKTPISVLLLALSVSAYCSLNFTDYVDFSRSSYLPANYTNFYELAFFNNPNEFYNVFNMVYVEFNFTTFFFFFTLITICFSISLVLSTSFKVKSYKWVNLLNFDNLKKKVNIFIKNIRSRSSFYVFFFDRTGLFTTY